MDRSNRVVAWLLLAAGMAWGGDFKVGIGRRNITPPIPIPMAGFDNRTILSPVPQSLERIQPEVRFVFLGPMAGSTTLTQDGLDGGGECW